MRAVRPAGFAAILILSLGLAYGRDEGVPWNQPTDLRWSGTAAWEYYRSEGSSQGVRNEYTSFRQKYSVLVNGSVWDPRFNRFSIAVDALRADRETTGDGQLDSTQFGYRAQTTFFPTRPFPLRLYARRSATDAAGTSLATNDRETAAWGIDWNLSTPGVQRLRFFYDRTSYELLSPVVLQELRKTGQVEFINRYGDSQVAFRYGLHNQTERVNGSDFRRQTFMLTDRTGFDNGATLIVNTFHNRSDALFSSGVRDELLTSRLSTRLDLPRGPRTRLTFGYDFNENHGRFLDSNSHVFKSQGRFKLGTHWESTGTVTLGRIETEVATGTTEQEQAGVRAGLRYAREWSRFQLTAADAVGFDNARLNVGPDRRSVTHHAGIDTRLALPDTSSLLTALSRSRDDNDTSGLGFTLDETRARVGWERSVGEGRKLHTSLAYRDSVRDTFQFGLQKSDEINLLVSLNYPRGAVSLSLTASEGVSEFLPDPGSGSPFLAGTDLVSESNTAVIGIHWRALRNLRIRLDARLEDRTFTTIGNESILSLHPEIEYGIGAWRFSAGYTRYERTNGTTLADDTVLLRISRRFY